MKLTYEPVIGLEIHVELATKSGMFCGCPADHFGRLPNTVTCPVCLGLPGALPVPNKKAVEWTIMLGLAVGSSIAAVSKFDRKHYFYPDLPKGYQISQYDQPFCRGGKLTTSFGDVAIHRIHLEEDTGKLQHAVIDGTKVTLVDFNRSGVPLVEIVTEADIHSPEQAREFLKKLHLIIRYLGISDADMEKGSMRLEPNISLRKAGFKGLPSYKVEIKNINSFRFAILAIKYEIERQTELLDKGERPAQETRGWDESHGKTVSQRKKEAAADYRYFPEPDIPPIRVSNEMLENIRSQMPPLPDDVLHNLISKHSLSESQALQLIEDIPKLRLFESVLSDSKVVQARITGTEVANWVINRVSDPGRAVTDSVVQQILTSKEIVETDKDELALAIKSVITENSKAVEDYRNGKQQSVMFLMGRVKQRLPKSDAKQILDALKGALENL